jgi:hypothetical protein
MDTALTKEPDNVIPVDFSADRPVMKTIRRHHHGCNHEHIEVDDVSRTVRCSDCGGLLDPVQAMLDLASRWDRADANLKSIDRERRRKETEIDAAKRELKNIKAKVARAKSR